MSDIGGTYDFTVSTPMGEQTGTMVVTPTADGNGFDGELNGTLGAMSIANGTINGNTLNWQMKMNMPLPMTLDCEAVVDGDNVVGSIDAGMMGKMAMKATRRT
ncbi:hypothetical protein [Aurantiacibacter sediminis]|uniref:Uncharacterized protein n=1 Tax=Aurantiacibacter sediminis TaxID=2793064 RepID=A0ABS0N6C1_9SPHN|nr:hypothetical protein [Aurantiacibacter sediminis]MBH5323364.1 hypothetical protein [Aurantiacibacter sediminis]